MDREETWRLFKQGKDAWNAWAEEMLAKRKALEEAGEWETNERRIGQNSLTLEWQQNAKADFDGRAFSGGAEFDSFVFPGGVRFQHAVFSGDAGFVSAKFVDYADFLEARFGAAADFGQAAFEGTVVFGGVAFESDTSFLAAKFEMGAGFWRRQLADAFHLGRIWMELTFNEQVTQKGEGFLSQS